MKKTYFLSLILLIVFTIPESFLHSRPGMGGSYRSSTSSSSSSSYRSSSSNSYTRSNYRSSGSSTPSSDSSPSIRSSDLDFSVSVVTSPTWDIKLKLQKEGSISVEESFSPSEIKVNTYVQKLDPDILKGIITISPPNREKTISRYLLPDLTTLKYKAENVFHEGCHISNTTPETDETKKKAKKRKTTLPRGEILNFSQSPAPRESNRRNCQNPSSPRPVFCSHSLR